MRGTFYLISGYLGHNGYLTRAQAHTLDAAGHEIGGHTVSHPSLPSGCGCGSTGAGGAAQLLLALGGLAFFTVRRNALRSPVPSRS